MGSMRVDPGRRTARALWTTAVAGALCAGALPGGVQPARAMIAIVAVPTLAQGLAVIVGLVAAGVVVVNLSESDRGRIAELESRRDWAGLSKLATERIDRLSPASAAPPGQPGKASAGEQAAGQPVAPPDGHAATLSFWLQIRARARLEAGGCAAAALDYLAASAAVGRLPVAELAAARCQVAAGQLDAAQQTLERLTAYATLMWDAHYHLGVVRALKGDLAGAEASLATLKSINPALAETLEAEFVRTLRERPEKVE
jgi:hypothetical protein